MESYIKLPTPEKRLYCQQAEAQTSIPAVSIEKDLWVTWVLRELFALPGWGEHLSFKGGTSLSKAWKLIDRFSEDIDVVVDRRFLGFGEHLSVSKQNKLRETCSERIHKDLQPAFRQLIADKLSGQPSWELEPAEEDEDPDQQTLLFRYPSALESQATYLRPVVKIEMGARSDTEPSAHPSIRAILCELFPDLLGEGSFQVRTVAARRTFWDKAMLLHEETYRPASKPRRRPLARHYYDLWALIGKGVGNDALADERLFERTAAHRQMFFRYGWMDYSTLAPGKLRLVPLAEQLPTWRSDYSDMRQEMFYGKVPTFDEILEVVAEFELKFNSQTGSG